jgi:LacI family transcriptional regulator
MPQSTIKDVAREAGVSIGTVDRVLHDRGRVSDENKEAVFAAVKKLNYRPSQIARALVSRKSILRIGISYPKVVCDFWSEIPNGIEAARNKLLPFGVELIIDYTQTYDVRDQVASIDKLISKDVNGILLTSVDDSSADQIEEHIPEDIPYATVVNPAASVSRCIFHLGPDDFLLGNLAARLISLFCGEKGNIVLLAPNYKFNGTQRRIAGVLSKISQDLAGLNLLRVIPISGVTDEDIRNNVYNGAIEAINSFPSLDAIYVSNGFFENAAFAVRDIRPDRKIKVFGHEYTSSLPELIEKGIVGATIYQKPAEEWYQAICLLNEILSGNKTINPKDMRIECSIIMKETLSSINIGGVHLF